MYLSLLLLFLTLICSGLLLFLRHIKTGLLILTAGTAVLFSIGMGYVPGILLHHLESHVATLSHPAWGKRNAIIVLGAGTVVAKHHCIKPTFISYSRMLEAAKLYFSCKKSSDTCIIIPSGGDPAHHGESEAETIQTELLALNVAPQDIIIEPNSNNTFQNAENTYAILKTHLFDSLILVTSGIHMRRSLLYFSFFAINPQPAPSDYMTAINSIVPLGYNFALFDFTMHEYVGMARFYVYNFFGWNKKPA